MKTFMPLFDDVVASQPSHTAVLTDGTQALSYADLQARARAVAAALRPQDLVAVAIEKSADYLVAVLGCWYARAAFLPLDPSLPPERLRHILQEAAPACVLTSARHPFPVTFDVAACDIARLPPAAPVDGHATAQDTAYVIYTSGSTGAPKGVVVTHAELAPVLQQQIELFQLTPQSRSLFYLSTAFDASVSDFGTALLAGATLCIESGDKIETAASLAEVIAARGITYADLPPALLRLMDPQKMPDCLHCICIGGEACPPATVRAWAATRRIVCVYGPTEATICTSAAVCDAESWTQPLIGRPLAGVDYHILDRNRQPAADGELYIGGAHLAWGYLGNPALTDEKFVMHDGRRLYRTGDRVSRSGEDIVFHGRIDRQFKWRGQLVEPEEIEQALVRQTGISRAAVLRQQVNGQERLVAHIEAAGADDDTALTAALAQKLPAWMLPQAFVRHLRLPLTATGKINAAALAAHAPASAETGRFFAAATPQEERLLACWQQVLGRMEIAADTPFSALGGDSFALLQLLLEAERAGLPLDAAFVTRHRTLAAQARHLPDTAGCDRMAAADLRLHVGTQYVVPAPAAGALSPPQHILLTGGTGFLGGQLLARMLERTGWTIYAHLRATDDDSGWRRLGLDAKWRGRVHILRGDITAARLGIGEGEWSELATRIDTVVHCAATVNMAQDFPALEPANLRPLQDLLYLCGQERRKRLHHASTLSVFVATDRNTGIAREDDALGATRDVYGGYAQTKWAAECLLSQAAARGFDITLHRLGLVTGDGRSGLASPHDFLRSFVEGVTSLGAVPQGPHDNLLVDVTPVDYAADMMLETIRHGGNGTCHIANRGGFSLGQILRALGRAGHRIDILPPAEWQAHVAARRLSPAETAAVLGLCRITPPPAFDRHRAMDLFQATDILFDAVKLQEMAGDGWRPAPVPDDALLDLYLRNFQLRRAA